MNDSVRALRLHVALLLCLAASLPACAPIVTEPPAMPQVFIVRHAEKVSGADPVLSAAGEARAQALARLLEDAGISRIFSTDTRRTRGTAAPLAATLGLDVEIYDSREHRELAERIRAAGETALVVGHSNTIGDLAAAFGADPGRPVDEATEFDRIYVISLAKEGVRSEIRRYGAE